MSMTTPQLPSTFETLALDSKTIFLSSLTSLSSQRQTLTLRQPSLSPIPSDFPQSKLIPKTRFVVDAFRFAGDFSISYFLTHFHSDHYVGLTPSWSKGVIFCSPTTARLLVQVLNVPSPFVVPVSISLPVWIDGCEITLIDANHCPGAVQFLFKIPCLDNGRGFERYVHTGDFRYCGPMRSDPFLSEFVGADAVFLDTTYCNPKFVFPSQEESVDYIVDVIERIRVENSRSLMSVLFLVATYVIGKERILLEVALRCDCKIHVDGRKMGVLDVLGYGESGVFTRDDSESDVHVVGWNVLGETWPYFRPNFVKMKEIMVERGYSKVVGFVPTGWTYGVRRNRFTVRTKDSLEIHLVPYSEHSNYDELREYVKLLRPKRVIPTVGMDVEKLDSKQAQKMQKHFAGLVDDKAMKQEFFMGFHRVLQGIDEKILKDADSILSEGQDQETGVKSNEMKVVEKSYMSSILSTPSSIQILQDSTMVNGDWTEELIKELHDCLPIWVTRNQLLDLLSDSDGNIVEAASNFYEHETEFHEEAIACTVTSSICAAHTSSGGDSTSLSKPATVKGISTRSQDFVLSQDCLAANTKSSVKGYISSGRKKRHLENKTNKKARINSRVESSGSKQPTITKFFNKLTSDVSQGVGFRDMSVECSKDEASLHNDAISSYKDELDWFMQIIGGDNSSRSDAATILEKAKGDVNVALNMHYANLEGKASENEKSLVDSCRLVRAQCNANNLTSSQANGVFEESRKLAELSVLGLSTKNVASTLVSLPPEKYYPVEHACWRNGQPAPFIHLARTFDLLEGEKGKTKATSMLCNMFRSLLALSPDDVLPAVYLCLNKIAADHENMELNIGGSLVSAALEEACGTNRFKIRDMYKCLGDLGDVAQVCWQTQSLLAHPPPLLIRDVLAVLRKISVQSGNGSTVQKKNFIVNLMLSCREKEMKFLVRTLVRNVRIGAMTRTVLPALAQAIFINSCPHFEQDGTDGNLKSFSAAVLEAYSILPNLDLIVPSLMDKGISFSSLTLSMVPGIPIKPMLAKIVNGIPQALKLFQNKAFTCEYKYDGQRAQIHKLVDGSIHVFSRKGDETTSRFPDLVNIVKGSSRPDATSFILDAEVVAVDRKNGCKLMSFQELSSRERGSKDSLISVDNIKVDICVFVFDIMFANGEKLLGLPLRRRRKYLKDLFYGEKLGYFEYAMETTVEVEDACLTNEATVTKINCFLEDAFRSSCEGIMVKLLDIDAGYFPSKRIDAWLKVKRDYVEGLNDSLDLVPMGAWYGNGRKAGWYSPFLMACYNPETEEFQSVCRVMSGFSDSFYKEMKEFFAEDKILSKKPPYYQTAEVPDIWFSPELVWQIRGADFTVSPVHRAAVGLIHPSRGISIRFPRFIRSVLDRKPEECSTAADIADLFHSQTRKKDVTGAD